MATNIRLTSARVEIGLTQYQLAEKFKRREIDLSRFETGCVVSHALTKKTIGLILVNLPTNCSTTEEQHERHP